MSSRGESGSSPKKSISLVEGAPYTGGAKKKVILSPPLSTPFSQTTVNSIEVFSSPESRADLTLSLYSVAASCTSRNGSKERLNKMYHLNWAKSEISSPSFTTLLTSVQSGYLRGFIPDGVL